ncbi:hypothetical protein IGI96_003607 [Enterococcus sp. DIV0421]
MIKNVSIVCLYKEKINDTKNQTVYLFVQSVVNVFLFVILQCAKMSMNLIKTVKNIKCFIDCICFFAVYIKKYQFEL